MRITNQTAAQHHYTHLKPLYHTSQTLNRDPSFPQITHPKISSAILKICLNTTDVTISNSHNTIIPRFKSCGAIFIAVFAMSNGDLEKSAISKQ